MTTPLVGREMAAMRSAELRRRAAEGRTIRAAEAAKRASERRVENRTPRASGILLPWRAVARGRAVGKVRTRPAAGPC